MVPTDSSNVSASGRQYKMSWLMGKYGLEGVGEELEDRWTAEENR